MSDVHLPDGVRLDTGEGGFERLVVEHPVASGEIYLYGAHVGSWSPRGVRPVLWLSPSSPFRDGRAIRGGVPLCFPWFGPARHDASAPAHGFARITPWTLEEANASDDQVTLVLVLDGDRAPSWHGGAWRATYTVAMGQTLRLSFEVQNLGTDALTFEEALHTYYAVSDVRMTSVDGLAGATFLDKAAGSAGQVQGPDPVRFGTEVDRLYVGTRAACTIDDRGWARRIVVEKTSSDDTVVWNPGPERADAMSDIGEGWTSMVCVETANVGDHAVTLPPGARHVMAAEIRVE